MAVLAGRQDGVVAHLQLIGLGFTDAQIEWRIAVGRLHPVHRGVVELDGPQHETTAARRRDPRRDATLQLHGYSVVRVPVHWFDTDPAGVIRTIRDFLSRAGRTRERRDR